MLSMMCASPSHETSPSETASRASLSCWTMDVRKPRLLCNAESGFRRSCARSPSNSPKVTGSRRSRTLLRGCYAERTRSAGIRFLVVRNVVDARDLLDLETGDLPRPLYDPRQG